MIKIYHAFNGFLYAPLFLADRLGMFPESTHLEYVASDESAVDALVQDQLGEEVAEFAVCDPFAVNLNEKVGSLTGSGLVLIGTLINKLPVWLYNTNDDLQNVKQESYLNRYKRAIGRIVSYPEGTTGYVIAKRVQGLFGVGDSDIDIRSFGKELDKQINQDDVVVSSNVFLIEHERGRNDILFNYCAGATAPENLKPYLFTGILTRRDLVTSERLWAAISVLGSIGEAIRLMRGATLRDDVIDNLVSIFD